MNINATLLVQMLNFLVAYVFLRVLLFRPAVAAVQQEDDQKKHLLDSLEEERCVVRKKEQAKDDAWRACQRYFSAYEPTLFEQRSRGEHIQATYSMPSLTSHERDDIVGRVTNALVEKVKHVH